MSTDYKLFKPKLSPADVAEIARRYEAGENGYALAGEFGISKSGVYLHLQTLGVKRRPATRLAPEQEVEVCERYLSGEHTTTLGVDYGLSNVSVGRILERHGIDRRSRSECQIKYACDRGFFDAIDTQEKAYWLGFVAADGHVDRALTMMQVTLARKDREHLVRLARALNSEHPIADAFYSYPSGNLLRSTLVVRSTQLARGLAKHGVGPNKTLSLEWPNLRPDLMRHYLRGYFDGDGCWYVERRKATLKKGWRRGISFDIMATRSFASGCQEYLVDRLGLARTKLIVDKRQTLEVVSLRYGGRHQVSRIFHHLYAEASVHLPRKKEAIEAHVNPA